MKRLLIVLALAAVVGLPFLLRPARSVAARADDVLVILTPHNEAIRHEFALGFQAWHRARTGRTVAIDWRVVGGTSEIARYLQGVYTAAFQAYWTHRLGRRWSSEVEAGFQNGRLAKDAPAEVREAREAFLSSAVGCGIDLFYGGGAYDFDQQAAAGRFWPSGVEKRHPQWFTDAVIPQHFAGEEFWRPDGLWFGSVISCYGILYNRDAVARLGIARPPRQWDDLADRRYIRELALCDPTKSGSIAMAFENVIQQKMHQRADGAGPAGEKAAVRQGWLDGLRLLQRIGANARYFTDSSQKPPIDVADGDCAAGMCIDFYGDQQEEALRRRGDSRRLALAIPAGGTAYSVDPIALLRGAPHRELADEFIDYVLSPEGQKLWAFKAGAPGGPAEFALRRLPIRRDFYAETAWKAYRSDPEIDPYGPQSRLIYRPQWTAPLFREMAFIIRVMCADTHDELVAAWKAIGRAPEPARGQALAVLQDLSFADYDHAGGEVRRALASPDGAGEIREARALADRFRRQYARAEAIAQGANQSLTR